MNDPSALDLTIESGGEQGPTGEEAVEAAVGLSREYDAYKAGRAVIGDALNRLGSEPSFVLLFATIHYKSRGGFEELLRGVWEILPEGTPLIGGTVAGFMNPYGCYTHGVTALVVRAAGMGVSVGVGENTKRWPEKAARRCAEMLDRGLRGSKRKNRFCVNLIPGPSIPYIPFIGKLNVVKSNFWGNVLSHGVLRLSSVLNYGVGKEEDVMARFASRLDGYCIIGGSTIDNGQMFSSYQFFGRRVYAGHMVALAAATDHKVKVKSVVGLHPTNKTFRVTKTCLGGRIITGIDGKPAKDALLEKLGISEKRFNRLDRLYRTTFYYPLLFEGTRFVTGIGAILGDNIMLAHRVQGKEVRLLSAGGREIANIIDGIDQDGKLGESDVIFISFCEAMMETLGKKNVDLKKKLDERFKGKPYLLVTLGGENIGAPGTDAVSRIHSFNILSIGGRALKEDSAK